MCLCLLLHSSREEQKESGQARTVLHRMPTTDLSASKRAWRGADARLGALFVIGFELALFRGRVQGMHAC